MRLVRAKLALAAFLSAGPLSAQSLDATFTYQGRLQDAGAPANGTYDLRFILYDAPASGSQVGPTVTRDDVVITNGLFTVSLDFGATAFAGSKRWLEVAVRPGASTGAYSVLSQRQELQSAPHAVFGQTSPWTGILGKPAGFADNVDNDVLAGLTCASGQLAKWNGTAWACATDQDTTYTAGAGLDLSGSVFSLADLGVTTGKLASVAVTTPKLADAAVTSPKLADAAVTSQKIADGTIGLADLGQNGCAANQVMKWSGTAWACAADANSGGTVTSVATGTGLTGGPIGTTGTVAVATGGITTALLANGAVTSPKIANGAVGLAQINTAEVQARVAAGCPPGQYLRGINPNGTVACEPLYLPNTITMVDGDGGAETAIATGSDGLPIVAFRSGLSSMLKVAHCGNAACTMGNVVTDIMTSAGVSPSMAIGIDGLPIIGFANSGVFLTTTHCGDVSCSSGNLSAINGVRVAFGPSVAVGIDGIPILAFQDQATLDLKVARCVIATCTTGIGAAATVVPSPGGLLRAIFIAIGADGLPVVSYLHLSTLKVAHCDNAACTAVTPPFTVDPDVDSLVSTSIAIGTDGLPIVVYHTASAGNLKIVHCGNAACTAGNTVTTVDTSPTGGGAAAIAIGTDGLPVISYRVSFALKIAHCGNVSCTAGNTRAVVDDPANLVGAWSSIAIGTEGLPIVSYADSTAADLKVAKCATRTCQ
jgi:hypothetical protein